MATAVKEAAQIPSPKWWCDSDGVGRIPAHTHDGKENSSPNKWQPTPVAFCCGVAMLEQWCAAMDMPVPNVSETLTDAMEVIIYDHDRTTILHDVEIQTWMFKGKNGTETRQLHLPKAWGVKIKGTRGWF